MENLDDEKEVKELSEIYEVLKNDAREIILDLEGGVTMWREAAAGALASAGFIVILIQTFLVTAASQEPAWESTLTLGFMAAVGIIMSAIAAWGFRRYFQLRRKYADLFRRAEHLQ
jgi:hypothetical protein